MSMRISHTTDRYSAMREAAMDSVGFRNTFSVRVGCACQMEPLLLIGVPA